MPLFLQNAVRLGEGSSAVRERIVLSCRVRRKVWLDGIGVAERYICGATEANKAGGSTRDAVGIAVLEWWWCEWDEECEEVCLEDEDEDEEAWLCWAKPEEDEAGGARCELDILSNASQRGAG